MFDMCGLGLRVRCSVMCEVVLVSVRVDVCVRCRVMCKGWVLG